MFGGLDSHERFIENVDTAAFWWLDFGMEVHGVAEPETMTSRPRSERPRRMRGGVAERGLLLLWQCMWPLESE
jgi:hypothetical protein